MVTPRNNGKTYLWAAAGLALAVLAASLTLWTTRPEAENTTAPAASDATRVPGHGASSLERRKVEIDQARLNRLLNLDDIHPIYEPTFVSAQEATYLDGTFVMGVAIDGEAKAYPIWLLNTREMVNDVVAGVPILVTW